MVLIQILKRKDAASLIVALVIAFAISQALSLPLHEPASRLSGGDGYGFGQGGPGWQSAFVQPLVHGVLQILALEIIARIYIFVAAKTRRK